MKLLFVSTGNVFRSMSAEYLAKKYIKDNKIKGIQISSAGTTANPQSPFSFTLKKLEEIGCNAKDHKQTRVDQNILKDKDWVICMAKHHQKVIKSFGYESVLFNFVAYNKNKDVMDEAEYQQKYGSYGELEKYCNNLVDYINISIPKIIKGIEEFEIEKKFLVKNLPKNLKKYPAVKMTQGYYVDKNGKKIRIRKINHKGKNSYFKTIKKGKGLLKKEFEEKLNKGKFENLWKKVKNWYLIKKRYILKYKTHKIELDVYEDKLDGLSTVEIEFKSPLESKKIIVPKRFGEEVTGKKMYSNINLAKR